MDETFFCVTDSPEEYLNCFSHGLKKRNPGQPEFYQAVYEVAQSLAPYLFKNKRYLKEQILERLTEPDRMITFRVCWEDDKGNVRTNRGYRVQFNNSIGPYKGGLRFHPSVNEGVFKFLAFEQIFKNSLTGLPIGGAKGGANFNVRGKSDREIMRFCQSFMTELHRHIGENVDVPAGDIGVGNREISYLFAHYKRLENKFTGALTGKALEFGGSKVRVEATGYGLVYFAKQALETHKEKLKGKSCLISGAGNVAQFAARKLIQEEAKVLSLSDSQGCIYVEKGINEELIDEVQELKRQGEPLSQLKGAHVKYLSGEKPWGIKASLAFPCATENELGTTDVKKLLDNQCIGLFEGANMPCTQEAADLVLENKLIYGPAKAANAGGVAISALEMSQNSMGMSWDQKHIDDRLQEIMNHIHELCCRYGQKDDRICYATGANIGGFIKVADAMLAYGIH
jgi:glutamate dehydrogenase (NADP+)